MSRVRLMTIIGHVYGPDDVQRCGYASAAVNGDREIYKGGHHCIVCDGVHHYRLGWKFDCERRATGSQRAYVSRCFCSDAEYESRGFSYELERRYT